ncbi:hypothetical protein DMUE_1102 [Dictyocoela muelleri]|nr:hypothetical protein DMUE_1102 [Dictyocoela muelleri]
MFLRNGALNRALNTTERSRDIVVSEIGIQSLSIKNYLPKDENLKDSIKKLINKNQIIINEYDIPISIKTTFSAEIFLLFDNGRDIINRILFFNANTPVIS